MSKQVGQNNLWDWGYLYLRGSRSLSAAWRSFRSPRITYSS